MPSHLSFPNFYRLSVLMSMAAGPRALSVHFPAVKIDKPVDGLQYVLKILSRRQLHVLSQNLRLPFLIRAIEDIIEVVASHINLKLFHMRLQFFHR